MITIDELRNASRKVSYGGIGVVRLELSLERMYRFYSDMTPDMTAGIHDHLYSFKSTVVKGALKNYVYSIAGQNPDSTLQVVRCKWKENADTTVEVSNAIITERCHFTTIVGQSYYLEHSTLHQIERVTPKIITLMERGQHIRNTGRVVLDASVTDHLSAMIVDKSEKECWEIIEYTLSDK